MKLRSSDNKRGGDEEEEEEAPAKKQKLSPGLLQKKRGYGDVGKGRSE